jgi:hypothetical protein
MNEATAHTAVDWVDEIKTFFDGARTGHKGHAVDIHLFRPGQHLAAILRGDEIAVHVMEAIAQWTKAAFKAKRGKGPICLSCDYEFGRKHTRLGAILVAGPAFKNWANGPTPLIVTGICRTCAARSDDDLLESARAVWVKSFGGHIMAEGRA